MPKMNKGGRAKLGRNAKKCQRYREKNMREYNKKRKLEKRKKALERRARIRALKETKENENRIQDS